MSKVQRDETYTNYLNPNFTVTRKFLSQLWNTKRPKPPPPPNFKGYWLSRICKCFGKEKLMGNSAKFGHFRWPNLAKSVKRHVYTPRPLIWAYFQDSTTIRYKEIAWKSSCFEKQHYFRTFWPNLAIPGRRIWPKLSNGTSTGQDLSYESIPRSLRPSVTTIQPGKESMTDGQTNGRTPRI